MHWCFDCTNKCHSTYFMYMHYASDRSYGLDWIGFGSAFRSSLWIGLDWVTELMDLIGLDLENWTHVQLCSAVNSEVKRLKITSFKVIDNDAV